MVMCEICNVWQHGLCMGYNDADELKNRDYYCEQCKPELHQELLKYVLLPNQPPLPFVLALFSAAVIPDAPPKSCSQKQPS